MTRPHRPLAKSPGLHPGEGGSIPPGVTMFQCDACEKQFETRESLAGHRSGHVRRGEVPSCTPQRIGKQTCPHCGKQTLHLKQHMLLHTLTIDEVKHPESKKTRLIEEVGHRCQVCNNTEWMGKPIPLHLDHIDGNPDHGHRENLRLLCPNCHAQTETYCGRNIGRSGTTARSVLMKNRKPYR